MKKSKKKEEDVKNIEDYIDDKNFTSRENSKEDTILIQEDYLKSSSDTKSKERRDLVIGKPIRRIIKGKISQND